MDNDIKMDFDQVATDLIVALGPKKLNGNRIGGGTTTTTKKKKRKNRRHIHKRFECHSCQKEFTNKQNLTFHIKEKHTEAGPEGKSYECPECDYSSNYQSNLSRHLLTHDDNLNSKPFECETCHQRFSQPTYLALHVERMHPVKMSSLKTSDVKRFKCGVCGKRFGVELNLKSHIKRLHLFGEDQKRFKCDKCNFTTHYSGALKRHLVVHDRTNAFVCEICQKNYTTRANLISHVKRTHTKMDDEQTKEYCCTLCDFQTHYKHSLGMHMNGHNGVKLYDCPRCQKRFTTRKVQRLHIERKTCTPPPPPARNRKAAPLKPSKPTIKNRNPPLWSVVRQPT